MNVVVTGGTKGIGRAICEYFFRKGSNLAICSRNNEDLNMFKSELLALNPTQDILIKSCDIGHKTSIDQFGDMILSNWDHIDVLVNNAGIFLPGDVYNEEEGILEQMIRINLYGAYHLTRKLIGRLLEQKKGHIINMCSIASKIAYPNGGSYSISKFALLGFSTVLREEMKDKGIKVTSVLPGATWSHSWKGVDLPKERLMNAGDIAKSVWNVVNLSPSAVVEEIIIRPQLGDL